jgi:hypothetical protein
MIATLQQAHHGLVIVERAWRLRVKSDEMMRIGGGRSAREFGEIACFRKWRGMTSQRDIGRAAERHEERSHAGAWERGARRDKGVRHLFSEFRNFR